MTVAASETYRARCDFCGRPFLAVHWQQRTCVGCATKGAPDQSLDISGAYDRKLALWSAARRKANPYVRDVKPRRINRATPRKARQRA